jgi:predicted O-methyltransferase YrrM
MSQTYERLGSFISEIVKLPIKMGSVTPGQQNFLIEFLKSHPEIKNILETGFHIGLSTATMLETREDIIVTSFDIFWFDYTRRAKLLLDMYYPGRNLLLAGNSVVSLPTFFKQFPLYKPDMVFIDGGHERPVPFLDIHYILQSIPEGTWVIIDDYCETHGMNGVVEAVNTFMENKCIENVKYYRDKDRGWIVGTRSSVPVPESPLTHPDELNKVYKDIESHYP